MSASFAAVSAKYFQINTKDMDRIETHTLKKSDTDNSLIIRLVEMEGKNQNVELKLFAPVMNLFKTNLIEDEGIDIGQRGKILNLRIGKNSIETFQLKL